MAVSTRAALEMKRLIRTDYLLDPHDATQRGQLLCRFLGRRHDETLHALMRSASEKRQGTKSREVWRRLGSESYGDFTPAPTAMVDVTLAGCELRRCRQARS
jgi:hypothetical protein